MMRIFFASCIFISTLIFGNVQLIPEYTSVQPGIPFWIKVVVELEPGAHTYGENPGEVGLPIQIKWTGSEPITQTNQEWGKTTSFSFMGITSEGYEDEADVYVQFVVDESVQSEMIQLDAVVSYLECTDVCIPKKGNALIQLPISTDTLLKNPDFYVTSTDTSLVWMLLLAFLGGIVLNVMPCVFPILSLKAIQILDSDPSKQKREGIGYTLGILVAFTGLGVVMSLLKWTGESIGWGFQLQSPLFVLSLALVMLVVGLSLQDHISLPSWMFSLSATSGQLQYQVSKHKRSFMSAFLTGMLATVVSTPCTAPFMATALGFALTQSYFVLLLVLWCLGLGLAFPFLVLSLYPSLSRFLPKSGPWLSKVKYYLAFPLYMTFVWLLWVFILQTSPQNILWVGFILICIVLGASISRDTTSITVKRMILVSVIGVSVFGVWKMLTVSELHRSSSFSDAEISQHLSRNEPVFVDVTASWCLTCKVNEKAVIHSEEGQQFFKDHHITVLTADWTTYDPEITRYLEAFNRSGVPLYVAYIPGKEPVVLPQLLTMDILKKTYVTQ